MDYDVNVLIQNIKTLCKKQSISLAQLWHDIFGVQKNISQFSEYPLKENEIEKVAEYFNVSVTTLTQTIIDPPVYIDGEKLTFNFKRLCKEHQINLRDATQQIFNGRKNIYQWKFAPPNIYAVQQIADYFHVPIEELIGQPAEPSTPASTPQNKPIESEKQDKSGSSNLKILFRNAPDLTEDNLNTINDMVSFLLDKQKKQNNDH